MREKMRIPAIVLIALILICFIAMAVALISGNTDLFFIEGGILVALFVVGFVLIRISKGRDEEKTEDEG